MASLRRTADLLEIHGLQVALDNFMTEEKKKTATTSIDELACMEIVPKNVVTNVEAEADDGRSFGWWRPPNQRCMRTTSGDAGSGVETLSTKYENPPNYDGFDGDEDANEVDDSYFMAYQYGYVNETKVSCADMLSSNSNICSRCRFFFCSTKQI